MRRKTAVKGDPTTFVPRGRAVLLRVQFDGSGFCGFQRQQGGLRSVGGELEAAWQQMLGEAVAARASSRTDAGVHARRLPVMVRTERRDVRPRGLMLGLNTLLPEDCKVVGAEDVPDVADVRADAVGKRYIYRVTVGPMRLPLWRRVAWHAVGPVDIEAMRQGAAMLTGIHDFAAFRSVHCEAPTTVRHIRRVAVHCTEEIGGVRLLEIEVDGNAFLHNMVRIFAGTLIDIGRRRKTLEQLRKALESGDRTCAGQTAPAHGLTLDDVFYGPWGARQGQDYKDLLAHMERARPDGSPASEGEVTAAGGAS